MPTSHYTTAAPSNIFQALKNMGRGKVKNELCDVELELKVSLWNHRSEICKETDVHKHTHLCLYVFDSFGYGDLEAVTSYARWEHLLDTSF